MRRKSIIKLCSLIATGSLFLSCNKNHIDIHRGRDPWAFRINLDYKPRMLVFALSDELWAAYDAQSSQLYKLWKGGINFNGPMYDDRHNVQSSTKGETYTMDTIQHNPWTLIVNGMAAEGKADYKGYALKNGTVTIRYEIPLKGEKTITISEIPEYTEQNSRPGFQREFITTGLNEGDELVLKTSTTVSDTVDNFKTTGGKFTRSAITKTGNLYRVDGTLSLRPNGKTSFTVFFDHREVARKIKPPVEAKDPIILPDTNDIVFKGKKLIGLNDCAACHSADKKNIGPSYNMIAAKYGRDDQTVQRLAKKVIEGGSGVWGRQAMTPHPVLTPADAAAIVSHILSLDDEKAIHYKQGIAADFYKPDAQLHRVPELIPGQLPNLSTAVPDLEFKGVDMSINKETNDFFGFDDQFVMHLAGFINVPESGDYIFKLKANAGATFTLNGEKIGDVNYSDYDYQQQEVKAHLNQGANPFRIEYYEDIYSSDLSLRWRKPHEKDFVKIPESAFTYNPGDIKPTAPGLKEIYETNAPGFGADVDGVHPGFDVTTIRPEGFNRRISDVEFLPDGTLAVSTWDSTGSIYLLEGALGNDRSKIKAHLFASGLYEVMGLEYVDGKLYALQKWELTELTDNDGDKVADEYRAVLDSWSASSNFHEWAFGLLYRDGYFYFNTSIALGGNGIITDSGIVYHKTIQTKDRGKAIKVRKSDWTFDAIAHGYKAPNGIGFGVDGEIFATDNEGHMVPTNKLMHVPQKGYPFFGNDEVLRQFNQPVPPFTPPAVWMPVGEISNSPSQPVLLNKGPFSENQMLIGDVHHGGIKRIFLEKINGEYQGAILRFSQGLEAGITRMTWGPDGNLYMAGLGAGGDFGHKGHCCGLQRLTYNSRPFFDIVAVRAKSNGMEIEFSQPLRTGDGIYASDYFAQQYWYETGDNVAEGGVKNDIQNLDIRSVNVSGDRKRVFLEINEMKKLNVIYIKVNKPFISDKGMQLLAGEAWYTLNNIPTTYGSTGGMLTRRDNSISAEEKKDGWDLLFNGNDINNWKQTGNWRMINSGIQGTGGGSMLLTENDYSDFELEFDTRVNKGSDGGLFFRMAGDSLQSGNPELQIIDDENHPDAKSSNTKLSAAAYGFYAPRYKLSKPAGEWNNYRLIVRGDHVEHWLNGIKVVEYDKSFNRNKKGRIAMTIQNGTVNIKNIRIRPY